MVALLSTPLDKYDAVTGERHLHSGMRVPRAACWQPSLCQLIVPVQPVQCLLPQQQLAACTVCTLAVGLFLGQIPTSTPA